MILHYLRLLKKSPKFILNSILMHNDNINVVWDPHTLYMMSDELIRINLNSMFSIYINCCV